ncbi:MAG TPA: hypothetical protein VHW23_16015 [Kofleriaceae bacterium]|jgi:hypothetical protein|nr:hypothetical protein [Kofleriaceae bacterium]
MIADRVHVAGALLAACAACAACNSHPGFPSGAPDAAADALSPSGDAGPDAVTVTVTLRGVPAGGVPVYFQNADSSLALAVTTDAQGTAGATLAAGGYVTVIEPDDGAGSGVTHLATFAATRPRDALHLDLVPPSATDAATFTVTVPAAPGANSYQLYTSCGQLALDASGTGSGQLIGCRGAADLIVIALDPAGAPVGSLYAAGVPVTDQPATVEGSYAPLATAQLAYTGVPASVGFVSTDQVIATARGSLFDATTSAPVAAGQATGTLQMPAADGAIGLTVSDAQPAPTEFSEQRVFEWGAWSPSYALDFTGTLLPAYASLPTYDPASRTVVWTERGGGVPPSFVRARIHAFRDGIPDGRSWTWGIVAPRGAATSVAFPRLSVMGFDFTPRAGDAIGVDDVVNVGAPLGYDASRAHGFDDVRTYVAGPSGRFVVETVYTPPL